MSQLQQSPDDMIGNLIAKSMHQHWKMFLAEGIVLTLLGFAAVAVPVIAGLTATLFLGWLFMIAGIMGLVATLGSRSAPGWKWALLSAVAAIVAGSLLLWDPLRSLVTLTYVLIGFFIIDGIFMIFFALDHRRQMTGKWEWMLINGVIDLILAAIIISGFPGTLVWALGLLVGIDMVFGGGTLIAIAMAARKEALR
ncbi:HdeD family acid-resistance protein [Acidiphilium sp.]|uniref:HdeD family acid-resistance protein n=1 Tax=Acidiphilium sp. TaxID=527 RepID=UPI003D042A37